jgi:membrane-bound lytic murein transglycosylase
MVTALVGFVVLTGCTQVTGAPAVPDRAAQAWTDRLDGLAQQAAQQASRQRADDAYAQRLSEQARAQETSQQARERADDAYAQRLTEQARSLQADATRGRADQAWTDRLNGLAEHLGAAR